MTGGGFNWDRIRQEYPIAEIVGQSVKLVKSGREWKGCCPFHAEKTPSFHVVPEKEFAHCFGCGWHGEVVDFTASINGCDNVEAVRLLTGGNSIPEQSEAEKAKRRDILRQREIQQQQERERSIAEARKRWERAQPVDPDNAYLQKKGVEPFDARQEGPNLLVPVFDRNGDIQSVQSIAPDSSKLFQPGAPIKGGRYNLGIAIGRVIVCEGFATGASIRAAIADCVRIAFSCAGVRDMVAELQDAGIDVAIAADRKGLADMLTFANERGVPVFIPDAPHDDFNDMAQTDGTNAVQKILIGQPIFALPADIPSDDEERAHQDNPTQADLSAKESDLEPVDVWHRNEPPSLPVGLLPPLLERFAFTRAKMLGGDPGGLAMSALAVCAAAIPDTVCVKVKQHEGWAENARLWVMLIGDPSSKKSPLMRAAAGRLARMDSDMLRAYEAALLQWQRDKKDGIEADKPQEERLRIEDVTMEAAQEVCRWSPKGILALQDELAGWFGGIEKYAGGKGAAKDRSFWLRAYNGGEYAVNRISRSSFLINNLSIGILGGIQPDSLRKIMADATEDGLIQRFMPVILPSAGIGIDQELPDVAQEYDNLISQLRAVTPPSNVFGPVPLTFSADARAVRERLEREHHAMVIALEGISKKFAAHIGKFDGMFPRLCVIWHCIESINADTIPAEITGDTADRCARFLHEYVLQQSKAFYHGIIGVSEDQQTIEDVAGYILAHEVETVTMRTFSRGSTTMRKMTKQIVEPVCQQLEALGWIESIDARGEKFTAKVNPRVHEVFAQKALLERERRHETIANIKKLVG